MAEVMKLLREQAKTRVGDDHRRVYVEEDTAVGRVCDVGYASFGYFHGAIYTPETEDPAHAE